MKKLSDSGGDALRQAFLDKLASSDLSTVDAERLRFELCPNAAKLDTTLPAAAGFRIPYFTADGRPDPGFWRFRYLEDTRKGFDKLSGRKPLRYVQPPNTPVRLYMPPIMHVSWAELAKSPDLPLIITEGELKAAVASKYGWPTIALGGVWSFMSKKRGEALIPDFDLFEFDGRIVYICYDSDAITNHDVMAAETKLANHLVQRGAMVNIVRLQSESTTTKVGLDDLIATQGPEAFGAALNECVYPFDASASLHELNARVVYVAVPGLVYDYDYKQQLSPSQFKNEAYVNLKYEEPGANGNFVVKYAAKEWLEWPYRAQLNGIVYRPGHPSVTEDYYLNTWRGWGVADAVAGDVAPWTELMDQVFGYRPESREFRQWFEQWCAYPIQNPGVKMTSGVLFWSVPHGTGKSTVGRILMRLYGDNAEEIKDAQLKSERNEWAANGKQFVFADDITGKDSREYQRRLMTIISQTKITVDPKYVRSYSLQDCMNWYFTSNDPDAFFLDDTDRRFFIQEVVGGVLVKAFRDKLDKFIRSEEGMQALFHYFLTMNLAGFDPYAPAPVTAAKREMTRIGKSELGAWVARLREEPEDVLGERAKGDLHTAEELHALYDPAGDKRATANALSRELKRAGFNLAAETGLMCASGCRRAYIVRNVDAWAKASRKEMVAHYDLHHPRLVGKAKKF